MTPDEQPVPVFPIKASDPFAGALIRLWISLAASYRGPVDPLTKQPEKVPLAKIDRAIARYDEFIAYQQRYGTKTPD